ncbi:MAG: complex I NDUFA9 subunit family protein, partial [Verrucomicrobiota bacterium]
MKVFVTGATGFVGRELIRQLDGAGHSVRILARNADSPAAREMISKFKAEVHPGNVLDLDSLHDGLDGVDAVIHLVGIISEQGGSTFEKIHTLGTQNMVSAVRASGVKRFLQVSALGVCAYAKARYHKSKWAAEMHVRNSGLDFTIFRPSIIYGRGDHFVNFFAGLSRWSPVLPVMGTGNGLLQPVPVEDVARCFVRALVNPRTVGQSYDLYGPEILTLREILQAICDATGRKRLLVQIPMPMARTLAATLEWIFPAILRKAPPLNRDQLVMLEEKTIGKCPAALEIFG